MAGEAQAAAPHASSSIDETRRASERADSVRL